MLVSSLKRYNKNGIHRVCNPVLTYRKLLERLSILKTPILYDFELKIAERDHIMSLFPICEVRGTPEFTTMTIVQRVSGKGSTIEQTYCSGLMEMVERYSVIKHIRENFDFVSSAKDLINNSFDILSIKNCLMNPSSLNSYITDEEIMNYKFKWYKCYDLQDNISYIPLDYIRIVFHGSNGMAAGNTMEEAVLHGACEVIERHCRSIIETEKIKTPEIDQSSIDSEFIQDLLEKMHYCGNTIILKFCSLNLDIPVICAINKTKNGIYTIAYGCATTAEEAIIRALIELIQLSKNPIEHLQRNTILHHLLPSFKIRYQNIKNIDDIDLLVELQKFDKVLTSNGMKMYYCDCTYDVLNIPSTCVYISNAKLAYDKIIYGSKTQELRFKEFSGRVRNDLSMY